MTNVRPPNRTHALISRIVERCIGLTEFDSICRGAKRSDGCGAFATLRDALDLHLDFPPDAVERVPRTGGVIVIANHPTGGMDAILLASFLLGIRSDVRFLGHSWFGRYPQFDEFMIYIDPAPGKHGNLQNSARLGRAIQWINDGGMLATFPAGGVAHLHRWPLRVMDPSWHQGLGMLVRRTRAPVLPVVLTAHNGFAYHASALLHPGLRKLFLVRELLNKRGQTLKMAVGQLISYQELARIGPDLAVTQYLRSLTN
jgi:putative hemolysin